MAVKVQYPGALAVMLQDLRNIRVAAEFLQVRAGVRHSTKLCPHCLPQQPLWRLHSS